MTDLDKLYRLNILLWEEKRIEDYNRQIDAEYKQKLKNSKAQQELNRIDAQRKKQVVLDKKQRFVKVVVLSILLVIIALLLPLTQMSAAKEAIYDRVQETSIHPENVEKEALDTYVGFTAGAYLIGALLLFGFLGLFSEKYVKQADAYVGSIGLVLILVGIVAWIVGGCTMASASVNVGIFWKILMVVFFPLILLLFLLFAFSQVIPIIPTFLFLIVGGVVAMVLSCIIYKKSEAQPVSQRVQALNDLYESELRNYRETGKELDREKIKEYKSAYEIRQAIDADRTLHASNKNLQTVGNLIWCIEHNYASGIVSAMNYLEQQRYNQAFQNQMRSMQAQLNQVQNTASQAQRAAQNAAHEAQNAAYSASRARDAAKKAQDAAEAPIEVTIEGKYL